ncbi:hypothetical protein GDO86_016418 [Hymenochirus boettgeri]|uniref:Olfactory receptor n=1 Tax=Hymenochirus boettgeri TaxID=247094 RepID=A0A8T2K0B4_9PIPI|nr:hypothetical protein GDO86_016418 [Hymenochirus boettgeri]
MRTENTTRFPLVLLLGFQVDPIFKIPIMIPMCILYILTVTGNLLITALVQLSQNLKYPMFFFLSHLSLCDIVLTTSIVPNMLHVIQCGGITITIALCTTQFQFFATAVASECLLLAVMSYDRYLAICNPLRYTSIMDNQCCLWLVTSCWFSSFTASLGAVIMINRLEFCHQNIINNFFCDFWPILKLSCSDTFAVEMEQMLIGFPLVVFPVVFICVTYIYISTSIFRISSSSGRQKAFSTCSSHLTVVCIFFGTMIANYFVPSTRNSIKLDKLISLFYTVITPLLNPIIYSLRNLEIRVAFEKLVIAMKLKSTNLNYFKKLNLKP